MQNFGSIEEFEQFHKTLKSRYSPEKKRIRICMTGCRAHGAVEIRDKLKEELEKAQLNDVDLIETGCHGFCTNAPVLAIDPQNIFYQGIAVEDVPDIVNKTIINGEIIEHLTFMDKNKRIPLTKEIPFYKTQTKIVLRKCGQIDPTKIEDYISHDGYTALVKAINTMKPEEITDTVIKSGLRGRGGGGFPAGLKWKFCRNAPGEMKYLICNGDEGDPGAFMDRAVLEGDPHAVIEGMLIAAYAIGAREGYIYVRAEYPIAVEYCQIAIKQAEEMGLLGDNILGTDFSFHLHVKEGAGAFVCGEETALIASIEGKRGMPRPRPPFPANSGLWGKPTNINNVETYANVTAIILNGAEWYASMGTEKSKGTKIFAIAGKINNTGLVEVPIGTTLREVVDEIGGGIPNGKKIKAVQMGGPSGGCVPEKHLDLPIDYESLQAVGAIMGSGGMIVMDEDNCMVDIARYFMEFVQSESCGKCVPCRIGTKRMLEILTGITEGKGKMQDIETLKELGNIIKDASLCGLGQTVPNPVMSTLTHFYDEYLEHIEKKRCRANVCKEIISSPCQHTCPIDTEASVYIALVAEKKYNEALEVIKKDNPLAATLSRVCNHPCESKCKSGKNGEPIGIRDLKRFVTDYGLTNNIYLKAPAKKTNEKKVAVIGSGPAGLSCAFFLAQKGYEPTIFEKQPVLGGMLAVGIPEYRLPKNILETDIDYIKSAGVEMKTNCALGKDFVLDDLFKEGYKAIFIATGAHESLKLNIPGDDANGVIAGMKLLTAINLKKDIEIGKKAGVIGGGNSAIDAARSILRTGKTESVTIYYRREITEMPAYEEEIEGALEEGIKIEFLTAPNKIIADNGKLKACEFIRMKMGEKDKSGRRSPIPIPGSEFNVELDTLVVSISEKPDIKSLKEEKLDFSKWGTVLINNETFETTIKGVFAGGDLTTGPDTAVNAVAAGKHACESIDKFLSGKEVKREYKMTRPSKYIAPLEFSDEEIEELNSAKRPHKSHISLQEKKCSFTEVEYGLSENEAVKEAKRCLRCEFETEDGKKELAKIKGKN